MPKTKPWAENLLDRSLLPLFLLLAGLSLAGLNIPAPTEWLEGWTAWIAAVVAIVEGRRLLVAGADRLISRTGSNRAAQPEEEKVNK